MTRADERARSEGCFYDPSYPKKLEDFFETYLTIPRGAYAGQPFRLLDWQRDIVYELFGQRRRDHSLRYRHALLHSPKKIGKSLLTSFLALSQLLLSEQAAPHVVLAAPTRKQAGDLYENIEFAVSQNAKLKEALHLVPSQKRIEYPKKHGQITIGSAESPNSLGGLDCSTAILDEVCLHPNSKLYDILYYSMRARRNPLMVMLSNAGWDRTHFYYGIYQKAKSILSGQDDSPDFLPIVYEVAEGEDWRQEGQPADGDQAASGWYAANPSLGSVFSIEDMRNDYAEACKDTAQELRFRQWLLAQWVQRKSAYVDLGAWDQCRGELPADLTNQPFFVGMDLASKQDLASVGICYPIGDRVYVRSFNFVPRHALEREAQNSERYRVLHETGSLEMTEGNTLDFERVRECIKSIPGKCIHIAVDKTQASETCQLLTKAGYTVQNFPQYPSYYNEPMKKLTSLIADRKIVHDGNECLRWCMGNLQGKPDERGRLMPAKPSEHLKIDAAVALIMAIQGTLTHDQNPAPKSVYDTRGISYIRAAI